jgi:uncharacterized alkaline shock family protein YloU
MNDTKSENTRTPGKTTIAPGVLLTIARLTTLEVRGVSKMVQVPASVSWMSKRSQADGIRIEIDNDRVYADIYVNILQDFNVREVSRNIQKNVARAISKMVGMEVGGINIHIEDIDYRSVDGEA